jgi:hypothetical protein
MSKLLERIATLEKQVNELANLTANHVARVLPLLIGWARRFRRIAGKSRALFTAMPRIRHFPLIVGGGTWFQHRTQLMYGCEPFKN